jgi:hypothetical protein
VYRRFASYKRNQGTFYRVRAELLDISDPVAKAAAFLFLDRDCFNEIYRTNLRQIYEALTKGAAASREAITILRELIDHILVTPTERPAPVELRVVGNLAALLVENTPGTGVAVSMVAGAGFEPTTFRL